MRTLSRPSRLCASVFIASFIGCLVAAPTSAVDASFVWGTSTTRVSVSSLGELGNDYSGLDLELASAAAISGDGRFVAFESSASNLVPGDTNNAKGIFVRDLATNVTQRVSVATDGQQANGHSIAPSISADGRYVAFVSEANTLSPEYAPLRRGARVYVRDLVAQTTEMVSVNSVETKTAYVPRPEKPAISADGRYVAFSSTDALTPADTNSSEDVYVRDRLLGRTQRVSVNSAGQQIPQGNGATWPAMSADGRYVAFLARAQDFISVPPGSYAETIFLHDRRTGLTQAVSLTASGAADDVCCAPPTISTHGRYVAFTTEHALRPRDRNGLNDVYIWDRASGRTRLISVSSTGEVAAGGGWYWGSRAPSISGHGRFVAFESTATNLVPGDTNAAVDAFVRDRLTRQTFLVSVNSAGQQQILAPDGQAVLGATISADGQRVAFSSWSYNLMRPDDNHVYDVFVRE